MSELRPVFVTRPVFKARLLFEDIRYVVCELSSVQCLSVCVMLSIHNSIVSPPPDTVAASVVKYSDISSNA